MKHVIFFLLSVCLITLAPVRTQCQVLNHLQSEYNTPDNDVCLRAQANFAMDMNVSQTNLASILRKLNLSGYNIDIIMCDNLLHSALAYYNNQTNKKYILI